MQVAGQIDLLGKHLGVRALPIYGGASYGDQFRGLKSGVNVVVGTPGRVVDHLEKGTLKLDGVSTLILDEADEMISMGFKDDLEAVLSKMPESRSNIWLFSATMSREVRKVADEYLQSPQQVAVNRKEVLSDTVEQIYYVTSEQNKPEVLCKLIDAADDFFGIVFCQTKVLVIELTRVLAERGYSVDCLHGDMDQRARERTMQAFRDRKVTLLICTDVASRGLDVKDVTHVINYSIPRELDNYIHRIGRTARSGKAGLALSLVSPSNRVMIRRVEQITKSRMTEGRIPSRKDIGSKKVSRILGEFKEQNGFKRAVDLMDGDWKAALSTMTGEEIAGRFLALHFPEVFNETREAPQLAPLVAPHAPARRFEGAQSPSRRFESRGASAPARRFEGESAGPRTPRSEFRGKPHFKKSTGKPVIAPRFSRGE